MSKNKDIVRKILLFVKVKVTLTNSNRVKVLNVIKLSKLIFIHIFVSMYSI